MYITGLLSEDPPHKIPHPKDEARPARDMFSAVFYSINSLPALVYSAKHEKSWLNIFYVHLSQQFYLSRNSRSSIIAGRVHGNFSRSYLVILHSRDGSVRIHVISCNSIVSLVKGFYIVSGGIERPRSRWEYPIPWEPLLLHADDMFSQIPLVHDG